MAVGEDLEDAADVGAGAAAGQLAVAERARASFAEEVVALGVERPAGVEPADVGDAVLDRAAAFEDQGAIAVLGEQIAGEQPRGAGADDHGPVLEGTRSRLGPVEGLGPERLDVAARGRAPAVPGAASSSGSSTSAA